MFINVRFSVVIPVVLLCGALLFGVYFGLRQLTDSKPAKAEPPHTALTVPPLVTFIEGFAETKMSPDHDWKELSTGDELNTESEVRTAKDSYVDIKIQTGTIVRVMPETIFLLSSLSQEEIKLKVTSGAIVSRVKKLLGKQNFQFFTPSTVAGIRGTELAVKSEISGSMIYGLSGNIEVYTPHIKTKTIKITRNQKTQVQKDSGPSNPLVMTQAEIDYYRKILDSLHENQLMLLNQQIKFEPDSFTLTPDSREELHRLCKTLAVGNRRIKIIGHTANIGSKESQRELSQKRADAVKEYLIELGIPSERLISEGVGGAQPAAHGDDEASISRNRYVDFFIE